MNLRFLILVWVVIGFNVCGQNQSLEYCINYALENNLTLSNKKINSKIAQEQLKQSKRNLFPSLTTGARSNLYFGRSIDPTTNDFVEQKIFSTNFYLSAQMNLFNGFVKQNTIKFNKLQYLISEEHLKQQKIDLSYKVMTDFYDAVYHKQLLDVVNEQLELTKLILKKTHKLVDLGLKSEANLLEMQAQEASELYRRLTIRNRYKDALLKLKRVMNYPLNDSLTLKESEFSTSIKILNIQEIYDKAVKHMPQLKITQLRVQSSEKEIDIERGGFYPSLTLGGSYSTRYADSDKENTNVTNLNDPIWETIAFNEQFRQNASQSIYLDLSIPLFYRWQSRSKVKIAKLNLKQAFNQEEDLKRDLYQQISEDYQLLQSLLKEKNHLKTQIKSFQKTYEIAEKKLNQGQVSVIEFYTAKNQLANAKVELLRVQNQLSIKEKTMEIYFGDSNY